APIRATLAQLLAAGTTLLPAVYLKPLVIVLAWISGQTIAARLAWQGSGCRGDCF
ncbi:hypothetical protein GGI18_001934, partial [Coemansia linderi]